MAQKLVEKVGQDFAGLKCRVVDLAESPETGAGYSVFSTPAIVINGRLAFSGVPKEEALKKRLEDELKQPES